MTPILVKWCLNCQILSSLNAFWYYADNFNLVQSMSLQWSPEVTGTLTIRLWFWWSGDFYQLHVSLRLIPVLVFISTIFLWCLWSKHSVLLTQTFCINLRNKHLSITGCTSHAEFSLFTFNYAFIMLLNSTIISLGLYLIQLLIEQCQFCIGN